MITGVNSIRMDDSLISKSDGLLINFSLQHLPRIKYKGQEQKGNYHQFKKLLIVKPILLVSTIRDLERKVLRTWILMLRYKGLICLRGGKLITKLALGTIFKTIKIVETENNFDGKEYVVDAKQVCRILVPPEMRRA